MSSFANMRVPGPGHDKIRNALNTGLSGMDKMAKDIAKAIENTDVSNQMDMIKLQQKLESYTNNSAMYSSLYKTLAETDKGVIHNM